MTGNNAPILAETDAHVIEVSEGWLTIDTKRFPDDCVSLSPEEAEEVLRLLLTWKHGRHTDVPLTE
jgi:hypothetical protein